MRKAITRPTGSEAGDAQPLASWGQECTEVPQRSLPQGPGEGICALEIKLDHLLLLGMTKCDHYVLKAGE